jgi:hypothetical protein
MINLSIVAEEGSDKTTNSMAFRIKKTNDNNDADIVLQATLSIMI